MSIIMSDVCTCGRLLTVLFGVLFSFIHGVGMVELVETFEASWCYCHPVATFLSIPKLILSSTPVPTPRTIGLEELSGNG